MMGTTPEKTGNCFTAVSTGSGVCLVKQVTFAICVVAILYCSQIFSGFCFVFMIQWIR